MLRSGRAIAEQIKEGSINQVRVKESGKKVPEK